MKIAIPIMKVDQMDKALTFYVETLGFEKLSDYRPGEGADPAYVTLKQGGAVFHISSFPGDGISGSAVNIVTGDIDDLFANIKAKGVSPEMEPVDQSWGTREFYIKDPVRAV